MSSVMSKGTYQENHKNKIGCSIGDDLDGVPAVEQSQACSKNSNDETDIEYVCTVTKTCTHVSVIRLAPSAQQPIVEKPVIRESECSNGLKSFTAIRDERLPNTNPATVFNSNPLECLPCGKTFTQIRNYKYHMAQHSGSKVYVCICPICGKSYRNKGYLSNHLKIHKNEKEYKCEWCWKRFNQKVAYNTHIRTHTGYCPHKCSYCGKAFSRKTVLTQHIRIHTGEKPYKCGVCAKAFVDKSNMMTHQRLHTGEKRFQCHICGKAFPQRNHLKTHINYHVGIKPYQCNKCNAYFSQASNLKLHSSKCLGILGASLQAPSTVPNFFAHLYENNKTTVSVSETENKSQEYNYSSRNDNDNDIQISVIEDSKYRSSDESRSTNKRMVIQNPLYSPTENSIHSSQNKLVQTTFKDEDDHTPATTELTSSDHYYNTSTTPSTLLFNDC